MVCTIRLARINTSPSYLMPFVLPYCQYLLSLVDSSPGLYSPLLPSVAIAPRKGILVIMSSSSSTPPPVDRDNLGRGPMIMAITWIFQIIALGFVLARLAVRRHKRVTWGWDDYLMTAAVTIQLALQSLATSSFTHGMGKHDHSLSSDEMMTVLRDNWVSVPPGIVVGLLSRTSIAILLSRLFAPYKWFTFYLISFTALMWVAGIVQMPLTYLQVRPIEALWNFTIVPTRRWDTRVWLYTAYFNQSCFTFSDLTYALFPVIFVWKLNMPLRERISLIVILCGSILSMTMSILKTIALGQVANAAVGTPDVQYTSSTQLIYGYTEQNVVIIMGCIPTLRAVMKLNFSKLSYLRRYYAYMKKSSASDYTSSGYTDLDTDSHKMRNIHMAKGTSKTSIGVKESLTRSRQPNGSTEQLPAYHITRTDGYTITYSTREQMPRETV
ncbi:hypothetical protein F5B19DRAFT_468553 [Rostrohypoxylon terebratum]|nr:hypothetical protein F5B19DRAFT_468553 [Rostrohypoxylon terebratum]